MNIEKSKEIVKSIEDFIDTINETEELMTNGAVGSFLMDHFSMYPAKLNNSLTLDSKGKPYKIGSIKDIDVYIDPYMRWDDNRIITKQNMIGVRERKISEALNEIPSKFFPKILTIDAEPTDLI